LGRRPPPRARHPPLRGRPAAPGGRARAGRSARHGDRGAAAGVPLGIVLARLLLRTVTESTELIFSMTVFTARLELSTWARFAGRSAVGRLVRVPGQLALAAAVLALGRGLMMTAATVGRSFEESVLDFIRRQVHADLVVASTAATGWIEAPLDEAVGDRLAAV